MHGTLTKEADWYMARRIRGTDDRALAALHRYRIPKYYPMITELRAVPMRKLSRSQRTSGVSVQRPVAVPMLPGYVLVQIHEIDRRAWDLACEEGGIGGFACADEKIVRISCCELERIRSQENGGMIDGRRSVRVLFGVGDAVTVTSGPFASFPGVVEKGLDVAIADLDPTARIKVAVSIFGRATPVELEVWQVAKRD